MRNLQTEFLIKEPPPPVEWVVNGFAARGAVSLLYGEPGVGKSYLALAFAGALRDGGNVGGIQCGRGGAVLVDAENSDNELARRMANIGSLNGQCGQYFQAFSLDQGATIDSDDSIGELADAIVRYSAKLVILDSLSALWPFGDENDRVAVTHLFQAITKVARDYDTAIFILHHPRRDGEFRGTGAIKAMSDIFIEMGRWRRDRDPTRRYLDWKKCRPAAEPLRHWMRMESVFGGIEFTQSRRPERDELWDS